MKFSPLACLLALWPFAGALARDAQPKFIAEDFDYIQKSLTFFEDSETALLFLYECDICPASEVYRTTGAGDAWELLDFPAGQTVGVLMHPTDNKVAITLGMRTHWITYDQGKKWTPFKTKVNPTTFNKAIAFHATDSKRFLFNGEEDEDCQSGMRCFGTTWYTTDGFESQTKLVDGRTDCIWAKSTERFTTGDEKLDRDRVVCITKGKLSSKLADQRVMISDDFFDSSVEAKMGINQVSGITNVAAVKGYIVAAAKIQNSREMSLFVTQDTETWHHAEFGEKKLEEDAYTLLESTNYSIQVDVMTSGRQYVGELFSSNSNGTYFTPNIKHTNRNIIGAVDFEKIQDIQGMILVNVVDNWKEVENSYVARKDIKSQISFDDGRTWNDLKAGKETLHLHSVTEQIQNGRIFSSAAPGLVLGVGNTGKLLKSYDSGDLYVSQDAGVTWNLTREGPHLYEFGGAGSIMVAAQDKGNAEKLAYSFDFGSSWDTATLPESLRVTELTTITDSTAFKFVLSGIKRTKSGDKLSVISIDFTDVRKPCKDEKDFEEWYARVDSDDKPTCIMGHKQWFRRRKPDADCVVDNEFREPLPRYENCPCSDEDFECDYNFKRDGDECKPSGPVIAPHDACKGGETEFEGSSGWRLIPGNDCTRQKGKQKDDPVMHPCKDLDKKPPTKPNEIANVQHSFKSPIIAYFYLERKGQEVEDPADRDETVIALTADFVAHISHDHGRTWNKAPDVKGNVLGLYRHQYNNDYVYLVTSTNKVYYSKNWGKTFHYFEAPELPPENEHIQPLMFHPKEPNWLMWIGSKDCEAGVGPNCHTVAHVSTTGGEEWQTILNYVQKCQFVSRQKQEKLILCAQHETEDRKAPLQLVSSNDWFEHKEVKVTDLVNFATMSKYIVVAMKDDKDKDYLKVASSVDGEVYAPALFPKNFRPLHQQAYTVLDSSTGAIFLHVTVNARRGQEYGSIIKSNSNGTSYVLSISNVNRNRESYVDFEKIPSIDGVAIVNIVGNVEKVQEGDSKELKTKMTHNDGADWALIPPPDVDSNEEKYECAGKGIDQCSLHLHGYSERDDPRTTFASPTAVGFVMGVGSVGPYLSEKHAETFISTNAGISWKAVKSGSYLWEYGDQGSVVAIVKKDKSTKTMFYTTDAGKTWPEHKFSERDVVIKAITSVPSDDSLRFLLWGEDFSISVDFSGIFDRKCKLIEDVGSNSDENDYETFAPKHPENDDDDQCLFGKITSYHRKKAGRLCYNDPALDHPHSQAQNCSCHRRDFECDYNFERQSDGSCAKVEGTELRDPRIACLEDPNLAEYWDVTGYRRIPLDTCSGGLELDLAGLSHPCRGHEDDYNRRHGISGAGLFFAILLPIVAAAAVGYFVFQKWGAQFGQIRLGDGPSLYSSNRLGGESNWIQWPVAAVSGVVAVVAAIPLLIASVFRSIRGVFPGGYSGRTYTSRRSFARGRGDYAAVDADEGELLGEDSDDEA